VLGKSRANKVQGLEGTLENLKKEGLEELLIGDDALRAQLGHQPDM